MERPGKKPTGNPKYPRIVIGGEPEKTEPVNPIIPKEDNTAKLDKTEEVIFDREIFNLSRDLIEQLEDYISQEKRAGVTLWDEKKQDYKKINKSLWMRDVIKKALKDAGYEPTPKRRG